MANTFVKCGLCLGNMWPDTSQLRDHPHLSEEERRKTLKLKYRTRSIGWNKPANPRTNSAATKTSKYTIAPRRKAYGPF